MKFIDAYGKLLWTMLMATPGAWAERNNNNMTGFKKMFSREENIALALTSWWITGQTGLHACLHAMSSLPTEVNVEDSPTTPLASPVRTSHEESLEKIIWKIAFETFRKLQNVFILMV